MNKTFVEECKHFNTCEKGFNGCVGCNVWNYLYDTQALIDWCKKQNLRMQDVSMWLHRQLKGISNE